MAAPDVQRPQQRATESFDDYIPDNFADFGGLFTDDEQSGPDPKSAPGKTKRPNDDGTAGLGIDEEVSVKKRAREPRVKLDESRLLSAKGIPALRQQARVLKLKGKGHEFSDASRLLSMYQLWLDDLFPKARFADALVMVEKEGHKTGMHKMRMEWINESKPKDPQDDNDEEPVQVPKEKNRQSPPQQAHTSNPNGNGPDSVPEDLLDEDLFDEDMYGASPVPPARGPQTQDAGNQASDEVPDESELDALMAEAMEMHEPAGRQPPRPAPPQADDFDDLDALIAEAEAAN